MHFNLSESSLVMLLYKHYSQLPTKVLTTFLKEPNLRFSRASSLNDPLEGILSLIPHHKMSLQHQGVFKKIIREAPSVLYICSLNKAPLNPLMWSHYAASHKGFMVEYELDLVQHEIQEVKYLHAPNAIEINQKLIDETIATTPYNQMESKIIKKFGNQVTDSLFTKSIEWEYEKEYRIIVAEEKIHEYCKKYGAYITKTNTRKCNNTNCLSEICSNKKCPNKETYYHEKIPLSYIKSIVFGVKTSFNFVTTVERIIRDNNLNIKTYQAEFIPNTFEITVPRHPQLDLKSK